MVDATGAGHAVGACLDSVAAQTLPRHLFEVVVVHTSDSGACEAAQVLRQRHPDLLLRLLEIGDPEADAFALGIGLARGEYVACVDAADRLSPGLLEEMLASAASAASAASDVVVVAVSSGAEGQPDQALRRLAGTTVPPHQGAAALADRAGKLLHIDAARTWRGGAAATAPAKWLELYARHPFSLRVVRDGQETSYLRGPEDDVESYDRAVGPRLRNLQALESVEGLDPSARELRDLLADEQARAVNRHLRRHPDEHARVVGDADALGLRAVPWPVLNHGLARDLAISYCFPPFLDTSGVVAAKRLRLRAKVTDVISHDMTNLRVVDAGSTQVAGGFVGRTHVVPGRATFADWQHISDFAQDADETVRAWEAEQGPYRSLYSRSMAPASHFAAALVKARRPDIHWVAEFSDPLDINAVGEERAGSVLDNWFATELGEAMAAAGYPVGPEIGPEIGTGNDAGNDGLRLFEWCERLTYALADEIIFTNEQQRELMLEHHCRDRALARRAHEISVVSPHPHLPRPCYEMATEERDEPGGGAGPDGVVRLAYFGVFYATRDLGDLVAALLRLRLRERERVQLHVFTSHPKALLLRLAREGLAGTVVAHAYLPFFDFLARTTRFDVLVVDDARTAAHHTLNPYLPSKLADYRGSGTPIWAISEPGSVMSSMRFPYESTLGDVDQAVAVFRTLLSERASR